MNDRLATNRDFPACGYGRSGLCCSACLLGPCRISPFDRDIDRGKCGASADRLVAGNLLQTIAAETAARLADLAQIANHTRASASEQGAPPEILQTAKGVFDRYGLDPSAVRTTGGAALLAEKIKDLFSIDSTGCDLKNFWSRLYPADVFPQFYSADILPAAALPLIGAAAFQLSQNRAALLEDILWMCVRNSLVYLVCEELMQDLGILRGKRFSSESGRLASDAAEALNPGLQPAAAVLLLGGSQGGDRLDREIEGLRKQWEGPLIEVSQPAVVFDISRQFYRRYSRPLADTAPLVIALAPSAAQIVGILACGFAVISRPKLPLSGSEPVVRFFCRDLKKALGSIYLPPEGGDILSIARNYLRKRS